jgi:multiple sugar transport system ATP-binding protein
MDEPLSNLDAKLRVHMRAEIARLQDRLAVTTIYVTHDQTEAMTLGDRVAVMRKGVLQQVDAPQILYDRPLNLFVGGFIGSPAMNLVRGRLQSDDGRWVLDFGHQHLELDPELLVTRPGLASYDGRDIIAGIRPEDLYDADLPGSPPESELVVEVELVEAMGSDVLVHFALDVPPVLTEDTNELAADAGVLDGAPAGRSPMVARLDPRTAARERQQIRLGVDTARLHAFDPESGTSIWDGPARERVGAIPEATSHPTTSTTN